VRSAALLRAAGIALLLAWPAVAQVPDGSDAGPTTAAVPGSDRITITGDHFVIEDDKHQATFTGHVLTVQPQVTVHSDVVVTHYGKGGAGNISSFEATGHVKLITKDQTATGDLAVFDPKTHLLTLTGNVVVINKTGQVQSSKLVVDLRKQKSVFTTQGGRVTGVFNSE